MTALIYIISLITVLVSWIFAMFWDVDADPNNELFFPKFIVNAILAWLFFAITKDALNFLIDLFVIGA